MKRLILAVAAVVAIGFTATSAQAGGWGRNHHHHHDCGPRGYGSFGYQSYYRPPVAYGTYVVPGRAYYPAPYTAYWPQNSMYYQGRNFGMQLGW